MSQAIVDRRPALARNPLVSDDAPGIHDPEGRLAADLGLRHATWRSSSARVGAVLAAPASRAHAGRA